MRHSIQLLAASMILGLGAAAHAGDWGVKSVEHSFETDTEKMLLPGSVPGTLDLHQCSECATRSLQVTGDTKFFIGTEAVALADLKAFVADGHIHFAMVFTALKEPKVLRVVVPGEFKRPRKSN
jgi:hypothetical protein